MLADRGAFRLFADADGATPIEERKRLEPALVAGADVVIGSRALVDPGISVTARRPRVAAGRVFNWLRARGGLEGGAEASASTSSSSSGPGPRLSYCRGTRDLGPSAVEQGR